MPEAALPVTERAAERITEAYLSRLGAEITKDGRRWTVNLPADADTALELDGATLVVTRDPADLKDGAYAIAPDSPFVERLLDEAADRWPVGGLALTAGTVEPSAPPFVTAGPATVEAVSFTPYYDRTALCGLFQVGIETVSEFQRETLRAVAVDFGDFEPRPELADTYLSLTDLDAEVPAADSPTVDRDDLLDAVDAASARVEDEIEDTVSEIRERATRAAEAELEEYREYKRQRLEELNGELDRIDDQLSELADRIDSATEQAERLDALRERKRLREDRESLRAERDEIRTAMDAGFPQRRRKVRDRHALTVRIRPACLTVTTYEKGDLTLRLSTADGSLRTTYQYAIGVGVTQPPTCEVCGTELAEANPLALRNDRIVGTTCCSESS